MMKDEDKLRLKVLGCFLLMLFLWAGIWSSLDFVMAHGRMQGELKGCMDSLATERRTK